MSEDYAAVVAERDALKKFKEWVHAYLDNVGVPHDPDAEHTAQHGCRISGRMNYLLRQRDDLLAACEFVLLVIDRGRDSRDEMGIVFDRTRAEQMLRAAVARAKGGA